MPQKKSKISDKKMVQRKLPEMFSSTKESIEKDKPKKKLKQTVESGREEGQSNIITVEERKREQRDLNIEEDSLVSPPEAFTSTFVRRKTRQDESDDEIFEDYDNETFIDDDVVVPHEVSSPYVTNEPEELPRDVEIRSKLSKSHRVNLLI